MRVEPLGQETELEADAVVVGSGAGGGVAAAELARRGLRVIVLEKGSYFPEAELGMGELEGTQKLYLDRNWTASISPPDWLREEWEREHGLEGLSSPSFEDCVGEVTTRLGISAGASPSWSSAGRLIAGCQALGYQAAELPRNVVGCGDDCVSRGRQAVHGADIPR